MLKTSISAAALALALSTGAAMAADLPSHKAPPPVYVAPPPPTWTGFYVGLNAGYTWSDSNSTYIASAPTFANAGLTPLGFQSLTTSPQAETASCEANNDGFIGGGQIGYNHQFGTPLLSVSKLISRASLISKKNSALAVHVSSRSTSGRRVYSSARPPRRASIISGRFAVGSVICHPHPLVYGTGGLAYGQVNVDHSIIAAESLGAAVYPAIAGSTSYSDTRVGWTAGGGSNGCSSRTGAPKPNIFIMTSAQS